METMVLKETKGHKEQPAHRVLKAPLELKELKVQDLQPFLLQQTTE
jgi:hypothetical protein